MSARARLRWWRRRARLWSCRRRGHPIEHPVVMSFQEHDRLLPDGTIEAGRTLTQHATVCGRCDQ